MRFNTVYPELIEVGNGLFKQCGVTVFATTGTQVTVATNLKLIVGGLANVIATGITANDSLSVIAGVAAGSFVIERAAAGLSAAPVYYEAVGKVQVAAV
jgi:hypothetical protein